MPDTVTDSTQQVPTDDQQVTDPREGAGGQQEEGGDFDASEFETSFGMPAGSLSGVTTVDEALQAIREYTDKTLVAGISNESEGGTASEGGNTTATDIDPTASDPSKGKEKEGGSELEQLKAKMDKLEQSIQQQEQSRVQEQMQEIDRRIMSEVDKWSSPTYGTSKSRNYNQSKKFNELCGLLRTHVAGCRATGEQVPVVEAVLKRVAAFHDENFKPAPQPGGKRSQEEALGTPGVGGGAGKGKDAPTNIHEALRNNW